MTRRENIPELAPVLTWWLSEINACLVHKIHSVILYGSAALGDFCPRWSDVDVCVVLGTPISPEEGRSIGVIHDRMHDRFIKRRSGYWESGQAVEGSYIPIALVADENLEMPCYTAGGSTRKWAVCQPISPFDRYMLAHSGCPLAGAVVSFTPPSTQSLVFQTRTDINTFLGWDRSEKSAVWMAGMLHWAARSLVFWRDGRMLSKSASLEHEISHGSPFAAAFRLALTMRRKGSATAASHRQELKRHFSHEAITIVGEIEKYVEMQSNISSVNFTRLCCPPFCAVNPND